MVKVGTNVNKPHLLALGALVAIGLVMPPMMAAKSLRARQGASREVAKGATSLDSVTMELSPAPRILLKTSGAPSFSSYSPQPDIYVIDLPGAVRADSLTFPTHYPSFINSVTAENATELGTGLTRITVRFAQAVPAHTASVDGGLVVTFDSDSLAPVVADALPARTETVTPATPPPATEVKKAPAVQAPESVVAAAPTVSEPSSMQAAVSESEATTGSTRRATQLRGVTTEGSGPGLRVVLSTNGPAQYSAFKLANPLRLVVDLKGVNNKTRSAAMNLGDPLVKRIRVAQFKGGPEPVTRVVLDLDEAVDYHVTKSADAVRISFGDELASATSSLPEAVVATASTPKALKNPPRSEARPAVAAPVPVKESVFAEVPVIAPAPPTRTTQISNRARKSETMVVRSSADQATPTRRGTKTTTTTTTTPAGTEDVFAGQPGTASSQAPLSGSGIGHTASRTLSGGDKVYTGEPIDLNLKDADIKDVLRTFAQLTGLNIAIDPQVSGTVTVQFEGVPWDQALEIILRQNDLSYILQGNVMRVGRIDRLATEQTQTRKLEEEERLNVATQTVIKKLSYAKANDVQGLLKELSSPKGRVIVDSRTNQLVITEVPQYLQTMLNLIETVDIPTPQVVIEARIIETTKTFLQQLGIDWGFGGRLDPTLGTGTGLVFPNRVGITGGPFNLGVGNPVLKLSLGNVLGTFDLDVLLTAAEAEGLARIVSAPKVTTQDNQSAEIQSGVQIPVQTRINFTTTITYTDATLRLTVTPQITSQDTVIMDISVQKTEPATGISVAGGTGTPLLTRRASTKVMVRDGGTTVIGGIYQSTENNAQTRVPFLHEIPVLGNLFKNRDRSSRHDELLIFITPRIVRNI